MTKEELDEAIKYHNYKEMKLEVISYKKLDGIQDYDFRELPDYMHNKSIKNATMAFRIKSGMENRIRMNYKGSYKHNLKCEKCELEENEMQCHATPLP